MVRRRKELSEKTRQDILDAAFEVFTRKGFMRTTLSDVACAAGVTRGAIYWHFKDKVDLFMALSDEIEGEAGVRPQDIMTLKIQTLDYALEQIRNYLAHFEKKDRYAVFYEMVNYRTEYTDELQPVLDKQIATQREVLKAFSEVLGRLKASGQLRQDLDPARAGLSLVAFVAGIIALWLNDPGLFSDTGAAWTILDDYIEHMKPVKKPL
jgi:TetR/AcrR family acrAB operon transcriptional repressor